MGDQYDYLDNFQYHNLTAKYNTLIYERIKITPANIKFDYWFMTQQSKDFRVQRSSDSLKGISTAL